MTIKLEESKINGARNKACHYICGPKTKTILGVITAISFASMVGFTVYERNTKDPSKRDDLQTYIAGAGVTFYASLGLLVVNRTIEVVKAISSCLTSCCTNLFNESNQPSTDVRNADIEMGRRDRVQQV